MNIKQDINMARKPVDIETKYDLRYIRKNREEISAVSKSVSVLDTTKQTKLISGVNIKTINNQSILGSGSIDILSYLYPVGSIYMSVNSVNPSILFGGTWEQIKDTFLLACGDVYSNGTTGGEATHILTTDEMPSHTHIQNEHGHTWAGEKEMWGASGSKNVLVDSTDGSHASVVEVANGGVCKTTATNQNTGGGLAHNNMPPYLAIYVWKRTT